MRAAFVRTPRARRPPTVHLCRAHSSLSLSFVLVSPRKIELKIVHVARSGASWEEKESAIVNIDIYETSDSHMSASTAASLFLVLSDPIRPTTSSPKEYTSVLRASSDETPRERR